jgi:hypothetical protein
VAENTVELDLDRIQVEVVPDPRFAGNVSPADLLERFKDRVEELGSAIGVVAERLRAALEQRLATTPEAAWELSEICLELGVNLEAEAGVVISKAKTGAAFQVSLTWSRPPGEEDINLQDQLP